MLERTIEGLRGFTEDCLPNAREKGILYGAGAGRIVKRQGRREDFHWGARRS